ncbi:uncharacterized protein LOC124288740 [Haliotis rubra]|uniref:uncharacterized protein LOC124288740 n=1 Tax=Haliotis rubra TaxID=36100 RepID=UPI001EE619E7|nr:uncharacterized protein LOC124288740 [Haliotis rubra]
MCSAIGKCDLETCTSSSNQVCRRCDGVVLDQAGHRAYVASSSRRSCIQACSWRSDSTRCYPGTCRNEYASSCACSSGFTGKHCQTITTKPTINSNLLRLTASNGDTTEAPPNINSGPSQSTNWSNINSPSRLYYKFTAEYKMVPPSRHAFIENFRVGIVSGTATFKLKRGAGVVSTKVYNCGGASRSSPDTDLYTCEGNSSGTSVLPLPFHHRDVIVVSYKATNGGYVKVRNKETKNLATFYYSGASQTRTFTMTIDLVPPYHCTGSSTCVGSMLTAPNAITTSTLNLRWSGWSDTDAGINHFVREVYELHAVGDVLRDKRRIARMFLASYKTSDKFRVFKSGVYSIVLSAYDKAGNYRSARRIMVYDGTSTVTAQANKKLRVMTAASASAWQTTSSAVTVDWTNRYINTVHHNNKWLLGVASHGNISSDYDDNEGSRGIGEVRNVQGITRFRTSYKVDHQGGSSITSPPDDNLFTSQGLNQSQTITPSLVDGDTVRFWIRAYDIVLKMKEENATVHIDTSPPVIENLWLSRSSCLNISTRLVEELHDVIVEFDVYDEHSGVEEMEWRIVEKEEDKDIVLAIHDISIQSQRTLDDCKTMHDARDGNCYCTPAGTCYHSNYQVKPALADIRDVKLSEGKAYWFQVTATNYAKLQTEQEVKIQMDANPLHPGVVHDGQPGQPEVDYQDNLQLHAHWEGFFDRESAIVFYQYTFGPRCLQGHVFDLNKTQNMESTRTTEATWTAPSCGKFYITVVAYNGAQQRSDAVCSDGVETCKPSPVFNTCSWRSDSTRCYPGTCKGEYASNCSCSSGFTGQHCQTITTEPTINSTLFRLTTSNGDTAMEPSIINSGQFQSTTWSNVTSPSRMYYKFTAKYKMVPPSRHAFIEDFRIGIVGGSASFKLERRWCVVSTMITICGGASRSSPETDLYTCEGNISRTSLLLLPFQHKDVIVVSYKATNGGYVKVRNKETKNLATFYYSGASQTRTFTMTIDLVPPYHCTGSSTCVGSMLTAPNAITTSTLNLRWSGWSDTDAGIDHFVREVYELHAVGDVLRDKRRIARKLLASYKTSDKFRVFKSGVYSVVLSAYDKAGNYRSARRIMVYDGTSTVTAQANKKLRVMTAASASAWQTTSSAVTVDWTNRYINTVHYNNKWLLGVASHGNISSDYDDNEGSRGIGEVRNVQGITRFRTSYKVDHQGGSSITSPPADNLFTSQGLNQSQTITPSLVDGDTVRFWIRAYDIVLEMKEENATVHIDTSPPVIENLWLSRSSCLNISTRLVEELHDVIVEFDVYDEHSGVEEMEWRIVEKEEDKDTVLAIHDISIQSQRTLDDCKTMHDARDGNCYCTPAGTCYHSNYQVKPALADIRDVKLSEGKAYWFQVTATNYAKLQTEQEVKIQMDANPLHPGVVHDGQPGQPEVDYQDNLQLHAHWEGFFDRESAIVFYQYTFGPRCLQGHVFDLNKTQNMESTRTTEATWTAPSCGKFYITVVAYNGAQQRSDAVCSDGVETCKPSPVFNTCSWRSDSTRCYPGTCKGEYASNCSCSSGFTGQHCQTITTEPTINSTLFRLTTSNGDTAMEPSIINSGQFQSTTWSNVTSPSRMYYKFTAKYKMVPPSRHAFIEDFRIGIVGGSASFKLERRWCVVSTMITICGGASRSSPETDLYTCEGNISRTSLLPLPFQHKDVIVVSYKATNGGYVKVRNKETKNLATFYYSGASQTRTFTMTIDLVPPYHCTGSSTCVGSMLTAPNAITTSTLNLRWSGWSDTDAGIDHFVREVYELHAVGDVLRDKRRIARKLLASYKTSDKFRVFKSGVYSVVLSAYDKAGNYRSARRIMVYDGTSTVTAQANKKLRVSTAASASAWQTTSSAVTVDWTNRYINTVHHNNKWLLGVASHGNISSDYDDNEGSRGIGEVRNVQGITRFRTSYKVDHQGGSSITSPPADNLFTSQGLNQSQTITPSLVDGDTVRFWIRAYDIVLEMKEENATVHIDTSPPVIENLSIYWVEELQDVIMEFGVYDEHSGLETLEWRIVEKRHDEDIVLTFHDISIQGQRTLDDCKTRHDARDGNCYCTPAGTCYHSNYQVKPALADIRDVKLAEGKAYWFQVTATNHAKLQTEQEVKFQMDASPHHAGVVHDGQSGQPEVDYQDSLQLHAHWEGFFDRESAVNLYQYTFGPRCLQGHLFDLNKPKAMESTRTTEATWTAPSCGKFYITVVAYNGAQQRGDAVCSDGVETCKHSPVSGILLVGRNLVLLVSATACSVVAVVGIVVGVVVCRRKRRGNPETSDQAVYNSTGSSKNDKPKKTKPRGKTSKPEAKAHHTLDVTSRETGPEGLYCSIQTPGLDETNL